MLISFHYGRGIRIQKRSLCACVCVCVSVEKGNKRCFYRELAKLPEVFPLKWIFGMNTNARHTITLARSLSSASGGGWGAKSSAQMLLAI